MSLSSYGNFVAMELQTIECGSTSALKRNKRLYTTILTVMSDHAFASNCLHLLAIINNKLPAKIRSQFLWRAQNSCMIEDWQEKTSIPVTQKRYTIALLKKYGMGTYNGTVARMTTDADIRPSLHNEACVLENGHMLFRNQIEQLFHLFVCTRPDIAFTVYSPARSLYVPTRRPAMMAQRSFRCLSMTCIFRLEYKLKDQHLNFNVYSYAF